MVLITAVYKRVRTLLFVGRSIQSTKVIEEVKVLMILTDFQKRDLQAGHARFYMQFAILSGNGLSSMVVFWPPKLVNLLILRGDFVVGT
jgi:hypothetical protein